MTNENSNVENALSSYRRVFEYRHERRENFESYSDLMTLLAISLIVVTVLLGLEFSRNEQSTDAVQARLAEVKKEGGGASVELPESTIIITFQINGYDAIMYQADERDKRFRGSPADLHSFLDKHQNLIRNMENIFVVTEKVIQGKSPPAKKNDYVMSALDWFRTKNLPSPVLLFTNP